VPFLALGLALLPTLPWLRHPYLRWALGMALAVPFAVNLDPDVLVDGAYFDDGLLAVAALAAIALPTLVLVRREPAVAMRATYAGSAALIAVAVVWPQAEDYLETRYATVWQGLSLNRSFTWAKETSDARIALAGTTSGFYQYGYYGNDVSNEVVYVGEHRPHGAIVPYRTCAGWRRALNEGDFDYVVTTPTLNAAAIGSPGFSPERSWTAPGRSSTAILEDGPVTVFELNGRLPTTACAALRPAFRGLPPLLRAQ
jgi:hypothetical protein